VDQVLSVTLFLSIGGLVNTYLTGVKSAVSANITTIAIPEYINKDFEIAHYVVNHG
jgi:hypothetical protein